MLNQDKNSRTAGGVINQENNLGKITTSSKENNKQAPILNKKLNISRADELKVKEKQSNTNDETQKQSPEIASVNEIISKDDNGEMHPNAEIILEETKNSRDRSHDPNKSGKNSRRQSKKRSISKQARPDTSKEKSTNIPPLGKKQVRFNLESKSKDSEIQHADNEAASEPIVISDIIEIDSKVTTEVTPNKPPVKPTEKKTMKSEMNIKGHNLHQRTHTMYTNFVVDFKAPGKTEVGKKPGISGFTNANVKLFIFI